MRYIMASICLFSVLVLNQVSWAGDAGIVKCGETAVIYANFTDDRVITVLVTDKCVGLDSAIIYNTGVSDEGEVIRIPVPDGKSTSVSIRIRGYGAHPQGEDAYPYASKIKLECNGTTGKGTCTFVIVDVK